jgi:solute carrier family 35 protein F5
VPAAPAAALPPAPSASSLVPAAAAAWTTAERRYPLGFLAKYGIGVAGTDWRKAAKAALIVCPVWFFAQGSYNLALGYTSVSSSTILSSSSCAFTFLLSVLVLREPFKMTKFGGVLLVLAGSVMVGLNSRFGPGAATGDGQQADTWQGDLISLLSAVAYAVYTTLIGRIVDDSVNMNVFFGWLGLFNTLLFFPIIVILHFTKVEDLSAITPLYVCLVLVKGIFDNVLSDVLWARAIRLCSPTVATVALSLTIPFAMVSDLIFFQKVPSLLLGLGSVAVTAGFVLSTVSLGKDANDRPDDKSTEKSAALAKPTSAATE